MGGDRTWKKGGDVIKRGVGGDGVKLRLMKSSSSVCTSVPQVYLCVFFN